MNFLRKLLYGKNSKKNDDQKSLILSTNQTSSRFTYSISEPTKSLLWITDRNPNEARSPHTITISITITDHGVGSTTKKDEGNIAAEPSLIWTKLPVQPNNELEANPMYYPSYHGLSPKHRYQYLMWLRDITKPTNLSYVFLYYYGLERHLLIGNYDVAFDEILRLIKYQDKDKFRFYVIAPLIAASLYRKKNDLLERAPFLFNEVTNEALALRIAYKVPLTAKDLINLSSRVGFYNKRYIKKYPDLFENTLQSLIAEFESKNGSLLEQLELADIKNEEQSVFLNVSIPDKYRMTKIPQILESDKLTRLVYELLSKTHTKIREINGLKPEPSQVKNGKKKKKISLPIAFHDDIVVEENGLPYPIVCYPGFYGAFFGFKKNNDSPITFCSCAFGPIENYIRFREKSKNTYSSIEKNFILSSSEFPKSFVKDLIDKGEKSDKKIINKISFKDKLCHECNGKTPTYRYCHEMYGGVFAQAYGWYVKKQAYEFGVKYPFLNYLPEICPEDVLALIQYKQPNNGTGIVDLAWAKKESDQTVVKEIRQQNRLIRNLIENEVRHKFGHKNIGEAWTSETILYYIVKTLMIDKIVFRHYRPSWLDGLELDIYIKEENIGIEYQGQQHYKPVRHWGGEEGLKNVRLRDQRKKELCKKYGIKLIYFSYDEPLSEEFVKTKLPVD